MAVVARCCKGQVVDGSKLPSCKRNSNQTSKNLKTVDVDDDGEDAGCDDIEASDGERKHHVCEDVVAHDGSSYDEINTIENLGTMASMMLATAMIMFNLVSIVMVMMAVSGARRQQIEALLLWLPPSFLNEIEGFWGPWAPLPTKGSPSCPRFSED